MEILKLSNTNDAPIIDFIQFIDHFRVRISFTIKILKAWIVRASGPKPGV